MLMAMILLVLPLVLPLMTLLLLPGAIATIGIDRSPLCCC